MYIFDDSVQTSVASEMYQKRRAVFKQLCKILPLRRSTVSDSFYTFFPCLELEQVIVVIIEWSIMEVEL